MLIEVEKFLRKSGVPRTKFGRDVAGDPHLVKDMRYGRVVGEKIAARIRAYIDGATGI